VNEHEQAIERATRVLQGHQAFGSDVNVQPELAPGDCAVGHVLERELHLFADRGREPLDR
jgi:hypothetical protein